LASGAVLSVPLAIGSGREVNDAAKNASHVRLVIEAALDGNFTEKHFRAQQSAHGMTNPFAADRMYLSRA
jgi:hypothetical protein